MEYLYLTVSLKVEITKLYKTAKGWIVNADCNGAANILKKVASILDFNLSEIVRGSAICPVRLNLYPYRISLILKASPKV